jgi:hypothetical protein
MLDGTMVTITGKTGGHGSETPTMPLHYTSDGLLNAMMPYGIAVDRFGADCKDGGEFAGGHQPLRNSQVIDDIVPLDGRCWLSYGRG